ncbi:MAG: WD40 repeat domain-containing protein, partial [Proteobacteria bacterium]|nr:WD40 repeat domain-containing protein [Pseudomonadota bacterium]
MDPATKPVLPVDLRLLSDRLHLYLTLAILCFIGSQTAFAGAASVTLGSSFKLDHDFDEEIVTGSLKPADVHVAIAGSGITHAPAVLFTPDGTKLFTGTSSGELAIFRASDRKLLSRKQIAKGEVTALSFDANGNTLAALTKDGVLRILDPNSGAERARKDGYTGVVALAVSPNGNRVAVGKGATVEVLSTSSLADGPVLKLHDADVTGLAWDMEGARLASVGRDGRAIVWNATTKKVINQVQRGQPLYAVGFSPKANVLAYGGEERLVVELNLDSGTERVLTQNQPFWITTLQYSPDGDRIALGDESCDVWLTDASTGEILFHSKHHVECWLSQVAWTPDSKTFLFGCRPNTHAGVPSTYSPNLVAEANQQERVKAVDKRITDRVVALKGIVTDNSELTTLEEQLTQLASASTATGGYQVTGVNITGGINGGIGSGYSEPSWRDLGVLVGMGGGGMNYDFEDVQISGELTSTPTPNGSSASGVPAQVTSAPVSVPTTAQGQIALL